jgi:hypothetical protein
MTALGSRALRLRSLRVGFLRHQLAKRLTAAMRRIADWALLILVVVTTGVGSSWYVTRHGFAWTTDVMGPWRHWVLAGRVDADPYTRAHFARIGALPLPVDIGETHVATRDSEGHALNSWCDYEVTFRAPVEAWWSLAVFDAHGQLVENPVERHAYTSQTAAIAPDGTVVATLSRSARPGNWLPTGGAGRLTLVYTLIDYATSAGLESDQSGGRLPSIRRTECR